MEVTAIHSAAGLLGTRPRADHPPAVPRPAPHRDPGRDPRRRHRDHPARRGRAGPPRRAVPRTTPPSSPETSCTSLRQPLQHGEVTVTRAGRRSGSRRSSPSSPAWPRAPAAPGQIAPAARCRRAATVPGWPVNSAATSRSSSMSARLDPGTTRAEPAHDDADAVSAARVADARYRARRRLRDTPWQPTRHPRRRTAPLLAAHRRSPRPHQPRRRPRRDQRTRRAPRSSGSPGPWPTWPAPPGPARTNAARRSPSSWE